MRLFVVITSDCPVCGKKVDCVDEGTLRGLRIRKKKDINVDVRRLPHNTPDCGMTEYERTTEAFEVPDGCLFCWREE